MTEELFPIEETLSPRLRWMALHEIRVYENKEMEMPFIALKGEGKDAVCAKGDTVLDALEGIAEVLQIKLWNQI